MTTLLSDAFTGTDGTVWNASNWTTGQTGTASTSLILGNAGRLTTGSATGYASASRISRRANITAPADAVWSSRIRFNSSEIYPQIYVRSTDTQLDTQGGYRVALDSTNAQWEVAKVSSFTQTPLQTATSFTYTVNTWYRIIFGVVGSAIKFQIYLDGAAQPSTWTYQVTDTTITAAGPVGITAGAGNAAATTFDIDDVVITDTFPLLPQTQSIDSTKALAFTSTATATTILNPSTTQALVMHGMADIGVTRVVAATQALTITGIATAAIAAPTVFQNISAVQVMTMTSTADTAPLLFFFTTPSVREHRNRRHRLWARTYLDRGQSILKFGTSYQQIDVPGDDQIEAADAAYIGGRIYAISQGEASALRSAGYANWVNLDPTVPIDQIDFSQYGAGAYGSGPYGD